MSIFWILLSIAFFALVHSLLASLTAKARAQHWLGQRVADGFYRLAYNLISLLTVIPTLALMTVLSDGPALWRFPAPLLFLSLPVQLLALLGLGLSLWRVDLPRFLGLRQLARFLAGAPEPRDPPALRTDGMHGWVRHPLYFFSLVLLWLMPVVTPNLLALNVGFSLYLWIGALYEERKLVREFGEAYRAHQRRVPMLFPWPRPRR